MDNKTVYLNNWVENYVISIKDLLKDDGNYLSFQEYTDKLACKTNFLQYMSETGASIRDCVI